MSASLFGLMLGTRANTRIVAVQSVTLLGYLTSSFLTGLYHPLRNVPFPLSVISNILPVRYYIDVSRDAFLRGAGWSGVWFANLALLMLGILILKRLHKTLDKMQFPD
jgi:ABC-2 type transport system permease protein